MRSNRIVPWWIALLLVAAAAASAQLPPTAPPTAPPTTQPSPRGEPIAEPALRDPTQPSGALVQPPPPAAAAPQRELEVPSVELRARLVDADGNAVAVLEVGDRLYRVQRGSRVMLGGAHRGVELHVERITAQQVVLVAMAAADADGRQRVLGVITP